MAMRVAVLGFALLLTGCDTSHVSEGIGPFKAPGQMAREAAAAARDPASAIDIYSPRLTRDGKMILFSFRYGVHPMQLAMMPADPADKHVTIVALPPMMDWFEAAWAPDEKSFAVVSRCEGDKCYEGAQGFNIWRAWLRPTDNLKRLTTDRPGIRRNSPVFGKDENEIYWVIAERFTPSEKIHNDVEHRFLVSGRDEQILFPAKGTKYDPDALRSDRMPTISMRAIGQSADGGLYFTSEVISIYADRDSPMVPAIRKMRGSIPSVLFRYADGAVSLGNSDDIDAAAVSRTRPGIVFTRRLFVHGHPGQVSDFFLAGRETPLFRFDSYAAAISASDALDMVVFSGTRGLYGQSSLWVWHKGDVAPADLNAPERIKEQCDREIAAEKAAPHP